MLPNDPNCIFCNFIASMKIPLHIHMKWFYVGWKTDRMADEVKADEVELAAASTQVAADYGSTTLRPQRSKAGNSLYTILQAVWEQCEEDEETNLERITSRAETTVMIPSLVAVFVNGRWQRTRNHSWDALRKKARLSYTSRVPVTLWEELNGLSFSVLHVKLIKCSACTASMQL